MNAVFPLRITCILIAALSGFSALYAQQISEKGAPWLDNYNASQYKNHGKIWDIASAKNGITYMAGDDGLLEFDGNTWNQFKGSKGYTRSLLLANDSLIYSGSDLDFGVWKRNGLRQFEYTSLYPFTKGINEENEEFWDVYQINGKIAFISFNNIYLYSDNQLTKIAAPHRFSGSFLGKDLIYLSDEKNGLYAFNGMSLKLMFPYPKEQSFRITGGYESAKGLVIITKNNGMFLYQSNKLLPVQNEVSSCLTKNQVFCATRIDDSYLAFGTILNGLYITDLDGRIIQHINKQKGLSNNTVLTMHYAANGMLWLGTDYGISAVHLHKGLHYFFDYKGEFGTAHAALLKDGVFYLGTNQGLYKAAWRDLDNVGDRKPLALVPGSEGQVWSLDNVAGIILCGHDKGLFSVSGNVWRQIHDEPGVWTCLPYKQTYLLTGNYNGISVFRKDGASYKFVKKLELILGSCNQLVFDKDNIFWVNIPNFGLIRFTLKDDMSLENRTIFPASTYQGNAFFLWKDVTGIQLKTTEQRYLFQPEQQQFVAQPEADTSSPVPGLLKGVYMPTWLDSTYQFYPLYNGFALEAVSMSTTQQQQDLELLFRSIEAYNNDARQIISTTEAIPYSLNNLNFQFIVPQQNGVLYQYQLLDYSKQWSPWSTEHSVDFLNLSAGTYTLQIRANVNGVITPTKAFIFSILPPWYRTWWAYSGYGLLALLLLYAARSREHFRLEHLKKVQLKKEQEALRMQAEQFEQQAFLQKQQQLEAETNLLKQQVKHKNIELTKQARDNQNKNRVLLSLKEKIEAVQGNPTMGKMQWAEMKRLLDMFLETDDRTFDIQIDELHQEFFKAMREQFPDLSLYDLRLCAYLKIGLNSKEISDILKVLPSSINVSRSRLRKKLGLGVEEDLYGFLNKVL